MRAKLLSLLLLLLLACSGYAASPDGTVEVLQMPSWVERDGKRRAARVGMTLRDGDQVRTGRSARVVLRLAEGSQVKIGENAHFVLSSLQQDESDNKLFSRRAQRVERGFSIYYIVGVKRISSRAGSQCWCGDRRDPGYRLLGEVVS